MKENKLSKLIKTQLTDYQRESFPLYVKFLEAYYEYMGQSKNTLDVSKNLRDYRDIDTTIDDFIEFFTNEYIQSFPKNIAADKKLVIKNILDFYQSKGTPKATELFFKIVYNEKSSVSFPQEQMLTASHSKWVQETSFRIRVDLGTEDDFAAQKTFSWKNEFGQFAIISTRYKKLSANIYEVFFRQSSTLNLDTGDVITANDDLGNLQIRGNAVQNVSSINVLSPGRNFRRGQIFAIPGTEKNSLFRVIDIGPSGELIRTQILDYGYTNPTTELLNISPFSFTGSVSNTTIETIDDFTYIEIEDFVSEIFDSGSIFINKGPGRPESYFAQDYLDPAETLYTGERIFNFSTKKSAPQINYDVAGISEEERNASVATIRTDSSIFTVYPGQYITNTGHISDSEIKLQDSYYYQIYSYVINSQVSINEYKTSLNKLLHPSGQIFFSNLNLNSEINIKDQIGSFVNIIRRLNVTDVVSLEEAISKSSNKSLVDSTIIEDEFYKNFSTSINDGIVSSDTTIKSVNKVEDNSVTSTDIVAKEFYTIENDIVAPNDIIPGANTYTVDDTYFAELYVSNEEAPNIFVFTEKANSDSVTLTDDTIIT